MVASIEIIPEKRKANAMKKFDNFGAGVGGGGGGGGPSDAPSSSTACGEERLAELRLRFKMFVLAEMKDSVSIKAWDFGLDLREAIANKLNKKLANKVTWINIVIVSPEECLLFLVMNQCTFNTRVYVGGP